MTRPVVLRTIEQTVLTEARENSPGGGNEVTK